MLQLTGRDLPPGMAGVHHFPSSPVPVIKRDGFAARETCVMIELLPLMLGVLLAQMAPGPNLMAVASYALGGGRRAGLAVAAGVAAGVFVWAIACTFGIAALFSSIPETIIIMKCIGGAYLMFLGLKALRAAWRGHGGALQSTHVEAAPLAAFRTGMLVVLTNPKAAMMWVAVSSFLAATHMSHGQFLLTGLCISLSALAIYSTYAVLFSTGMAMKTYARFSRMFEAGFGLVFGAVGAKLFIDGIRAARA